MGLTSAVADIGCGGLCCGVFFFFVAVADIGGRWLICGCGRWLWAVAVDLQCGLLLLLLMIMGGGDNILF